MFDHISISTKDVKRSMQFYQSIFVPFGYTLQYQDETAAGFGPKGQMQFWIGYQEKPSQTHLAFRAQNRKQVQAFYEAALQAGAKDNGAPGVRSHYHENYYAAFVLDPDGNNIEAVCHLPL